MQKADISEYMSLGLRLFTLNTNYFKYTKIQAWLKEKFTLYEQIVLIIYYGFRAQI